MALIQLNGSAIRLRIRWLTAWPSWRVVRPSTQNAHSERIEYIAIDTVTLRSCSGGTLGWPLVAYIGSNSPSRSARTASTTVRIRRIG